MKNNKSGLLIRLVVVLGIFLSLSGGRPEKVQAQTTCTWDGTVDTDWFNASNWEGCYDGSAKPVHPGVDHDVVIPAGKSNYPWLTVYQGAVAINSLTINAGGQITVDEQTGITATQVINYGLLTIKDEGGHWLRINAPFDNYGTVEYGTEPSLVLYLSGTHTGSFSGRQLSFFDASSKETNTFENGSTITVEVLMVQENHAINLAGDATADRVYIENESTVTVTSTATVSFGEIILRGGEYIVDTYTVASGEDFSGTGTIQTDFTNAGTVSPGNSPGTITIDGNYTQESSGTLSIEIGGTASDTEYDQLVVSGAANLNGTLDVSLINDFSPALGDSFTVLTYASQTGTFSTVNLPDLPTGLKWDVDYGASAVTLTVRAEEGSISGEVTYIGSHGYNPATVSLFTDPGESPVHSIEVTSTTGVYPYSITGIPNGTYYIGALMDLNGSHQPESNEPFAWYSTGPDGVPTAIVISNETNDVTDIDIQLTDPVSTYYLPLFLH